MDLVLKDVCIVAWLLVLGQGFYSCCLVLFAGCKRQQEPRTIFLLYFYPCHLHLAICG